MKLVLSWLKDFITLHDGVDMVRIADGLMQLGHEVEGIETVGGSKTAFSHVVVGRLLTRVPHPNADRLGLCTVDVGDGQTRQIVCGAPNARDGLTVAVALPGAELPGGVQIKKGSIRGVESNGMICSKRELGLGTEHEGIWEMDTQAVPGTPVAELLAGDAAAPETVLEVSVTPNRGDALSHYGMARELAALGLGTLQAPGVPVLGQAAAAPDTHTDTPACDVLRTCVVQGVPRNGPSPDWVQRRLTAAGLRPRNAIVDATNYVMLSLGQPMHAYDAAKVTGGLRADKAQAGEEFAGLNDVNLTLRAEDTVIRDGSGKVVGLAGILGGRDSAVSEATTNVWLEAAHFARVDIALTGQAHHLHSDARSRFERGVDPAMAEVALKQCAAYITAWAGGNSGAMGVAGELPQSGRQIGYDPRLCGLYGGLDVADERQQEILQALGFGVAAAEAIWTVTAPTWRTTMDTPEDVVEEILRVVGYDAIPSVLPPAMAAQPRIEQDAQGSRAVEMDRLARRIMASNGVLELVTYSFIGREAAVRFTGDMDATDLIELANPLAETSMTTLRPSLLPGLLQALSGNLARQEMTPRIGEVGKVYHYAQATRKGKETPADVRKSERNMLTVVLSGGPGKHWRTKTDKVDVFAAKGLALALLNQLGAPAGQVEARAGAQYHPGRSGTLRTGPFVLARFGELHPRVLRELELAGPVAVLELELDTLLKLKVKDRPWRSSPYQAVKRDLAFVVADAVAAGDVLATLQSVDAGLVKEVQLFDVYAGEALGKGVKSLAFSVQMQAADRTLTEADIQAVVDQAVQAVQARHGGTLRV